MSRLLFILICFFFIFSSTVLAQDKTSEQYYSDLLKNYRTYQSLVEPYNTQKSRHLTYQTVATQADFLEASKKLALAEVESIISYTSFIRTYLAEATRILQYRESYLYVSLDDELAYLNIAKDKISSLSSLAEMQKFLDDLALHFKKVSQAGFQIKAITEVEFTKKSLENVKIESDKIENFLSQIPTGGPKIDAAKEKQAALKDMLKLAENSITAVDSELTKSTKDTDFRAISGNTRYRLNQVIDQLKQIVAGFKNITFSLKQG